MKIKRICAAAFLLLLALCACGKAANGDGGSDLRETPPETIREQEKTVSIETTQKEDAGEIYHLTHITIPLPEENGCETAQCLFADTILVAEQTESGAELFAVSTEGEATVLPLPEDTEYVFAICETNWGFSVLYGSAPAIYRDHTGSIAITETPEGRTAIANYNEHMELVSQLPLAASYAGSNQRFTQMLRGEAGFYLLSAELLTYVGDDGAELARQEIRIADGWRFAAMELRRGRLYVLASAQAAEAEAALWEYELAALEQTDTCEFSGEAVMGMGASADGSLLLSSNRGIDAFDPQTHQRQTLVFWEEIGAAPAGERLQLLENGYLFYTQHQTAIDTVQWQQGEQQARRVLTMAVTTPDIATENVRELVQAFNGSQDEYQVRYTTYSSLQDGGDQSIDLLRTKLIAGDAPDLFYFCSTGDSGELPIKPENVCIDLLTCLDDVLTEEALVPNLYQALFRQDRIFQQPLIFVVDTVLAPKALIAAPGITVDQLEAVRAQAGEDWVTFEGWNTAENLFALSAPFCMGKYVDQDAGVCQFQTQAFYDHLNWCRAWGGSGSSTGQERALLRYKRINSLESLAGLGDRAQEWFGAAGYTYAGFPNENSSGSTYCLTSSLGISAQCEDLEGAIQFAEFCFSYAGDHSTTLPANYEKLKARIDGYLAGEETDWRGKTMVISESDARQFYDLLCAITELRSTDDTVMQIMQEEAAAYFAGQHSAEETAETIQARVSLYLMEQ